MKVLIQCAYPDTPHFETELEIALNHLKEGHEVYFLLSIRKFKHCCFNPENKFYRKTLATSIFSAGMQILKEAAPKDAKIHVLDYPVVKLDNDIYPTINTVKELKQVAFDDFDIGLGVASSLISYKRDHEFDVVANSKLIRDAFYTSLYVYKSLEILLKQFNFDKVVLFNGRFVENRPLLRLCQKLEIAYITHERAGMLDRYSIRENNIPHSIQYVANEIERLWETSTEEDKERVGCNFFTNRRNKAQQGWYSYTTGQKEGLLPKQISHDHKRIVIFNSSIDEFEGIDGYENLMYNTDNEGIGLICEFFKNNSDTHIYLRVHPNLKGLKNTQMKQLWQLNNDYDNLTLIAPEEAIDSYALMEIADVVLTFGSTIGIEAAFWGKPVISAGRSFAENLNCFYKPTTHDELISLLSATDLAPLDKLDAIKYGYWEQRYGQKFEHYQPSSVTLGTFKDKAIEAKGIFKIAKAIKKKLRGD